MKMASGTMCPVIIISPTPAKRGQVGEMHFHFVSLTMNSIIEERFADMEHNSFCMIIFLRLFRRAAETGRYGEIEAVDNLIRNT